VPIYSLGRFKWEVANVEFISHPMDEENRKQILDELVEVIYDYFAKLGHQKAFSIESAQKPKVLERIKSYG
jgi:hypothetical protein